MNEMNEQTKHTPGAIRVAEIITGSPYDGLYKICTTRGKKTTRGIADLIDTETGAAELLEALRDIAGYAGRGAMSNGLGAHETCEQIKETARAAIAKAEGVGR